MATDDSQKHVLSAKAVSFVPSTPTCDATSDGDLSRPPTAVLSKKGMSTVTGSYYGLEPYDGKLDGLPAGLPINGYRYPTDLMQSPVLCNQQALSNQNDPFLQAGLVPVNAVGQLQKPYLVNGVGYQFVTGSSGGVGGGSVVVMEGFQPHLLPPGSHVPLSLLPPYQVQHLPHPSSGQIQGLSLGVVGNAPPTRWPNPSTISYGNIAPNSGAGYRMPCPPSSGIDHCQRSVGIGLCSQQVGVQASSPMGQGRSLSRSSARQSKVVIYKEVSIQTDFNDSFCNLTLSELPNSLFLNEVVSRLTGNDTSTADDANSDSGYSSPLHHHKNQACGGPSEPVSVNSFSQSTTDNQSNAACVVDQPIATPVITSTTTSQSLSTHTSSSSSSSQAHTLPHHVRPQHAPPPQFLAPQYTTSQTPGNGEYRPYGKYKSPQFLRMTPIYSAHGPHGPPPFNSYGSSVQDTFNQCNPQPMYRYCPPPLYAVGQFPGNSAYREETATTIRDIPDSETVSDYNTSNDPMVEMGSEQQPVDIDYPAGLLLKMFGPEYRPPAGYHGPRGPHAGRCGPAAGPYGTPTGHCRLLDGPYGPPTGPHGPATGCYGSYAVPRGPPAGPYGPPPGHYGQRMRAGAGDSVELFCDRKHLVDSRHYRPRNTVSGSPLSLPVNKAPSTNLPSPRPAVIPSATLPSPRASSTSSTKLTSPRVAVTPSTTLLSPRVTAGTSSTKLSSPREASKVILSPRAAATPSTNLTLPRTVSTTDIVATNGLAASTSPRAAASASQSSSLSAADSAHTVAAADFTAVSTALTPQVLKSAAAAGASPVVSSTNLSQILGSSTDQISGSSTDQTDNTTARYQDVPDVIIPSDGKEIDGVGKKSDGPPRVNTEVDKVLHFEDDDEFPNLLRAAGGLVAGGLVTAGLVTGGLTGASGLILGGVSGASRQGMTAYDMNTFGGGGYAPSITYSDILRTSANDRSTSSCHSSVSSSDRTEQQQRKPTNSYNNNKDRDAKLARKKQKRQELADQAAHKELAEISLEQQVLRELGAKQFKKTFTGASGQAGLQGSSAGEAWSVGHVATGGNSGNVVVGGNVPEGVVQVKMAGLEVWPQTQLTGGCMITSGCPALVASDANDLNKDVNQCCYSAFGATDGSSYARRVGASSSRERDLSRPKKPSTLKKVILKEREEQMRQKLNHGGGGGGGGEGDSSPDEEDCSGDGGAGGGGLTDRRELSAADIVSAINANAARSSISSCVAQPHHSSTGGTQTPPTHSPADMSPVSQLSPADMSPMSSPAGSGGVSPIAGNGMCGGGGGVGTSSAAALLSKIHSRRFREYCNQVLDKEIDDCCTLLLQDLVTFQDRLYHKNSNKAKNKRRFVLGLREVTKHLKLNKLKCVIISPNLERIQSKGGLDDALNAIIELCREQHVPFVFALGRRALGRACAKLVPVSVVGIFNYDGSEEHFNRLCGLTEKARESYTDMVNSLQAEMNLAMAAATAMLTPNPSTTPSEDIHPLSATSSRPISSIVGGLEKLFPHMGHSRTPSACSAISFISSILSEPISENYPQSEPETDSRGYEIDPTAVATAAGGNSAEKVANVSDSVGEGKKEIVVAVGDAEMVSSATAGEEVVEEEEEGTDGHEADTEDDPGALPEITSIANVSMIIAVNKTTDARIKEEKKAGGAVTGGWKTKEGRKKSGGKSEGRTGVSIDTVGGSTGSTNILPKSSLVLTGGAKDRVSPLTSGGGARPSPLVKVEVKNSPIFSGANSGAQPSATLREDVVCTEDVMGGGGGLEGVEEGDEGGVVGMSGAGRTPGGMGRSAENKERIESWVAESMKCIEKRLRVMSGRERGEEEEEEEEEDRMSVGDAGREIVEDVEEEIDEREDESIRIAHVSSSSSSSSSSLYEDTCEVMPL